MSPHMTITIIIPVYNVEPYVERCLQSVISQTYKGAIECIIVDDCGKDQSMEVVKRVVESYDGPIQFKILSHEHNCGLSAARNTGIYAAAGDWLYFLDSDDWIIPECVESMVKCVEQHPEVEMVYAGIKVTKGSQGLSFEKRSLPEYSDDRNWINKALLKRNVLNVTAPNKLARKSFVIENKLFFAEGYIHEDDIWNFEMAKYVSKIAVCRLDTYVYVIHEGSIMSNTSRLYSSRMILAKYFANHVTDLYRRRQISFIYNFVQVHFNIDVYWKKKSDIQEVCKKLIKESRGTQKLALWIFYIVPKRLLNNLRLLNSIVNRIGKVIGRGVWC